MRVSQTLVLVFRETRILGSAIAVTILWSCNSPTEMQDEMHPQTVVLLVTPKMLPDFDAPDAAISQFFERYEPLTAHAVETIVIFAVGNSDHILRYGGLEFWGKSIEWARTTDFKAVSDRILNYDQIAKIVRAFRARASTSGVNLKVFEHIDSGSEFTLTNDFKYVLHPECTANKWGMFDIRGKLQADSSIYASSPIGIIEGKSCGEFLSDQVAQYLRDLNFDGIMFDNQLGTRGRWHPGDGPGFSVKEAGAIDAFLQYSIRVFGEKELMWFDSYNPVPIEHQTFSFPSSGYGYFDYLIASGFCAVAGNQYPENLRSKLSIPGNTRILATLDYVDPWYTYNSMITYPQCSARLAQIAVARRREIDGVMFFANDEVGNLIPRDIIETFASEFFRP